MRRIQNLMEQWLFIGPDNRQEQVNLPHTWNAKDGHFSRATRCIR